ncbi:MAG: haloacid dehalogenase [Candidatus Thorarchaeota archaeon]
MGFERVLDRIREEIEADDLVREKVLPLARTAVRNCSESIKMSHRGDFEKAKKSLAEANSIIIQAKDELLKSEFLMKTHILDTAYQELAEAANILSILERGEITPPVDYDIPSRPYLTGLGDTVGELRRAVLESLREDNVTKAVNLLSSMENILENLNDFDFPNALVPDLRRKCDVARNLIERTRGDVTNAVRQTKMIHELREFEERMQEKDSS